MDMFSNVAESFSNNLIVEDRYRMIPLMSSQDKP